MATDSPPRSFRQRHASRQPFGPFSLAVGERDFVHFCVALVCCDSVSRVSFLFLMSIIQPCNHLIRTAPEMHELFVILSPVPPSTAANPTTGVGYLSSRDQTFKRSQNSRNPDAVIQSTNLTPVHFTPASHTFSFHVLVSMIPASFFSAP